MATVSASTIKKVGAVAKAPVKATAIKTTAPKPVAKAVPASTVKKVASVAKAPAPVYKPLTVNRAPINYGADVPTPPTGGLWSAPKTSTSYSQVGAKAPVSSSVPKSVGSTGVGSSGPRPPVQSSSAGQSSLPQVSRPSTSSFGSPLTTQQTTKVNATVPWASGFGTPLPANQVPNWNNDAPTTPVDGPLWAGPKTPSYIPMPQMPGMPTTPGMPTNPQNTPNPQTNTPPDDPGREGKCGGGDCAATPTPLGGQLPERGPSGLPPVLNSPPPAGGGELPPGPEQMAQMMMAVLFPQLNQSMSFNMPQQPKLPGFARRGFNGDGPYNSQMLWGDWQNPLAGGWQGR